MIAWDRKYNEIELDENVEYFGNAKDKNVANIIRAEYNIPLK